MSSLRRWLAVFLIAGLAGTLISIPGVAGTHASACPFCTMQGQTLTGEVQHSRPAWCCTAR
jgi:hypothetical protein